MLEAQINLNGEDCGLLFTTVERQLDGKARINDQRRSV